MQAGSVYHIYSRAVGQEKLFRSEENYRFFMMKYKLHTSAVADTFCWSLLPDHFHILIQTKPLEAIEEYYKKIKNKPEMPPELLSDFIMERFSNWLNSYTKAFNKVNERIGSLFVDYMSRVPVLNDEQFGATIFYIHKNPVHHGLAKNIESWHWSSYKSFVSNAETALKREKVLEWFQGIDGFKSYHQQEVHLKKAVVAGD